MANIIAFNEFTDQGSGACGELACWLCQRSLSARALFCHACGAIQPVRALDGFARLGLEPRIDIDLDLLERRYAALKTALDPARFEIRGLGERTHAAKQREAALRAYNTLRDPLRRGRYWLQLHGKADDDVPAAAPSVDALARELEAAENPAHCDRVAQKAGQALEDGIMSMLQALRGENWAQANATLTELDGLESLLASVHARRATLMPTSAGGGEITRVK